MEAKGKFVKNRTTSEIVRETENNFKREKRGKFIMAKLGLWIVRQIVKSGKKVEIIRGSAFISEPSDLTAKSAKRVHARTQLFSDLLSIFKSEALYFWISPLFLGLAAQGANTRDVFWPKAPNFCGLDVY